jgi:hypothetical protein
MTATILFVWSVMVCESHVCHNDWRQLGVFNSEAACVNAAYQLNLKDRYRCVNVGRPA